MGRTVERWTAVLGPVVVVSALLACKKKEEPPPVASAAPVVSETATAAATTSTAPPPKKSDVERYGDKESEESGTVRVAVAVLRVYPKADASSTYLAEITRGTLVNRKARYGNWLLIDYPSGPGELSPGWVMAAMTSTKVEKVDPTAVANQDAGVTVNPVSSTSAVATASAVPTSSAVPTATASATASAVPTTTATATSSVKPVIPITTATVKPRIVTTGAPPPPKPPAKPPGG
jgi:hypothetical protein